jgi:hypothetical protein
MVNRVQQQEHKERKDADKATRKRREEHRKAYNLVWVQQEKEGLSLPMTPENTDSDSDSDGDVVWSELEEGCDDDVPLAAWAKGKDVVQARAIAASATGATLASESTETVGVPGTGGVPSAQALKKHKRPVSTRR